MKSKVACCLLSLTVIAGAAVPGIAQTKTGDQAMTIEQNKLRRGSVGGPAESISQRSS